MDPVLQNLMSSGRRRQRLSTRAVAAAPQSPALVQPAALPAAAQPTSRRPGCASSFRAHLALCLLRRGINAHFDSTRTASGARVHTQHFQAHFARPNGCSQPHRCAKII